MSIFTKAWKKAKSIFKKKPKPKGKATVTVSPVTTITMPSGTVVTGGPTPSGTGVQVTAKPKPKWAGGVSSRVTVTPTDTKGFYEVTEKQVTEKPTYVEKLFEPKPTPIPTPTPTPPKGFDIKEFIEERKEVEGPTTIFVEGKGYSVLPELQKEFKRGLLISPRGTALPGVPGFEREPVFKSELLTKQTRQDMFPEFSGDVEIYDMEEEQ